MKAYFDKVFEHESQDWQQCLTLTPENEEEKSKLDLMLKARKEKYFTEYKSIMFYKSLDEIHLVLL